MIPTGMLEMLKGHESAAAKKAMDAMLQMKKVDLEKIRRAYAG